MGLWFWVSFLVTLLLLAGSVWSGLTHRRRVHFVVVPLTVVSLLITIRMTGSLVETRLFPEEELAFHLRFAISATAMLVPVAITGIGYARWGRSWRLWHRLAVAAFLLLAVTATVTGVWVFSLSEPR